MLVALLTLKSHHGGGAARSFSHVDARAKSRSSAGKKAADAAAARARKRAANVDARASAGHGKHSRH